MPMLQVRLFDSVRIDTDGNLVAHRLGRSDSPVIAIDRDQVLAAAGSRYTYCPTPLALTGAVALDRARIALVRTSCQASVPAVMGAPATEQVAAVDRLDVRPALLEDVRL